MMNYTGLKNQLRQASFYIPFTRYFLAFAVAAVLAFFWLNVQPPPPGSGYANILLLLLKVATSFAASLIIIALITVLIPYVYFLFHKRRKHVLFSVDTHSVGGDLNRKHTIRLRLSPVLKPLFGFIRLRLQYDGDQFSDKFSLLETGKKVVFSNKIEGIYHWPLPQIKEYKLEKAILYFEDIFQFFSLATDLDTGSNFFTHPTAGSMKTLDVSPRKTEETNTRIDELRRVEGEFLHYKKFGDSDDVRRIVWKIYAKNKELVVRVPEILDPYASHIYMYTSFFTSFDVAGNKVAEVPFLNYYKVMAWTVYDALIKKGYEVKYIPDQEVAMANYTDEHDKIKYQLSTSSWHQEKTLGDYVKTEDASVVLVSSFSDATELQQLAERHGSDVHFIFIRLSDALHTHNLAHWIKWFFVNDEDHDGSKYKTWWSLSPLKNSVMENERKIQAVLEREASPVG